MRIKIFHANQTCHMYRSKMSYLHDFEILRDGMTRNISYTYDFEEQKISLTSKVSYVMDIPVYRPSEIRSNVEVPIQN